MLDRLGDAAGNRRACVAPARKVALEQLRFERLERQLGVADEPQRRVVAADLGAVDVEMYVARLRREQGPAVGAVLIGPRTDEEDDVGIADEVTHLVGPAAFAHEVADDAEGEGMGLVDRALAHHGRRNRQRTGFLECRKGLSGL